MDEQQLPNIPSYRAQRRSGMDPATTRLAVIAVGIGAALVVMIGIWSAGSHHSGGVPVIEAQQGPIRVKPENPGGMQIVGTHEELSSNDDDNSGKLAPAAEAPATAALKAELHAVHPDSDNPPATDKPVQEESTETDMSQPAMQKTEAVPEPVAPTSVVSAPPVAPKPIAPKSATVPQQAVAPSTGEGGAQVQLAALDSEPAAMAEWQKLRKQLPGLLDDRQPHVIKVALGGKTFYRLRTGGFADMAQATQFCLQVRAKGAACSLAAF